MASPGSRPHTIRFGPFELDPGNRELRKRGNTVKLQPQQFDILLMLVERAGQVVPREEIRERIWDPDTFVEFERSINFAINQIRAALKDNTESPRFIETVPKRGYRFITTIDGDGTAEAEVPNDPIFIDRGFVPSEHRDRIMPPSNPVETSETAAAPSVSTWHSHENDVSTSTLDPRQTQPAMRSAVRPRRLLILGVVVVLAAGGWAIHNWRSHTSRGVNREALEIRRLTETGNVDAVAISRDSRYVVYARRTGESVGLRMRQIESSGDVEVLPAAKVNFVGLTFYLDGNYLYFVRSDENDPGYKNLYIMPALGGPSRELIPGIDSPVSFSPEGRQMVFTVGYPKKNQIEVRIANPDGTGNHLLTTMQDSSAGYQPSATWFPDGQTIAVPVLHIGKIIRSALYAVSVADGAQHELYSADGAVGRSLWHPDGSGLLMPLYEQDMQRGQLWTISFPTGRRTRITNDLSNYAVAPDMTQDGENVVVVESSWVSNIWASAAKDMSQPKQITFGDPLMRESIETNDGVLLVLGPGEIWKMNSDGTARASFAKLDAYHVCICERFVVASVRKEGLNHIVRLDGDGTDAVSLAKGTVGYPTCSLDGRFVFYPDVSRPQRILRVPIEGGDPVELATIPGDGLMGGPTLSNDGKSLGFIWERYLPVPGMYFSIVSPSDGSLVKSFTAPPGVNGRLRWSPDDKALEYILTRDGVDNLRQQSLTGEPPKPLTKFTSGLIFNFDRAKSDKRLLLARGNVTSNAVLISHLR